MHSIPRFARKRAHLSIACIFGIIIGFATPTQWLFVTRILTGWNAAVWVYLCSMGWLMMTATQAKVREIAEQEDQSAAAVLAILSVAAIISLAAILVELTSIKDLSVNERTIRFVYTAGTVVGSWCLLGTLFTFHYAHLFYRSPEAHRPLAFPDKEKNPDYWDFLYFSFTIAVALQTSDVLVMTRSLRKVVLAQSLLSFLFNAAILGLSINIAASLIGA